MGASELSIRLICLASLVAGSGVADLAAQISPSGRCAVEGPVFWGRARAMNMTPTNVNDESVAAGLTPNMRLEPVSGRVTLDCEEGLLVFRQFAVVPDHEWRGTVAIIFDATGHPRHFQFRDLGGLITTIGIVSVNYGSGQQKAISSIGTASVWFEIDCDADVYRELFLN
jgi:hypothetical protein